MHERQHVKTHFPLPCPEVPITLTSGMMSQLSDSLSIKRHVANLFKCRCLPAPSCMASNKQENGFELGDRWWQCSVVPEDAVYTNSIHQVLPPSSVCDEPMLTIYLVQILTSTWATLGGPQAHLTRHMVSIS